MITAGEATDIADVAQQPGGAGRADPVELLQRAAGGLDQFGELLVRSLIFLSMTVTSVMSSEASCRRVRPTMSRGRTVLSSARACGADRNFFAPPGTSSSSR